jgi:hypothetical protein
MEEVRGAGSANGFWGDEFDPNLAWKCRRCRKGAALSLCFVVLYANFRGWVHKVFGTSLTFRKYPLSFRSTRQGHQANAE